MEKNLHHIGLKLKVVRKSNLSNFKVCKILKAIKHPDADKLKICDVDIGDGKITKVVCGARNAKII